MGFFGKMFGQQPQYPDLAGDSTAAGQLAAIQSNLEQLARDVRDPMEVVPADDGAYVFIGKPPKKFGIAWIEGGEIKSFKTLMEEHGMTSQEAVKVSDQLRDVYVKHQDAEHYRTRIADRDVVVIPSQPLELEVREILSHLH
ncbi:MAG TPA: hypothetical protein VGA63_06825 [Geopsychrobacteraceae bacterium]|jgi:hypothetical protein